MPLSCYSFFAFITVVIFHSMLFAITLQMPRLYFAIIDIIAHYFSFAIAADIDHYGH